MKRRWFLCGVALLVSANLFAYKSGGKGGSPHNMSVQVREVYVRSLPNYMAPKVGRLVYGDEVDIVGKDGAWCQISSPSGWVPESALTKGKIKLSGDAAKQGVVRDEVALAGKGMGPDVEMKYRKQDPEMEKAYRDVEWLENFKISDEGLKAFMSAGKLGH